MPSEVGGGQLFAAFVKREPDLELTVHLGKVENGARVEPPMGQGRSPLANKLQVKESQALLDLGRARADLRVNAAERPDLGGVESGPL